MKRMIFSFVQPPDCRERSGKACYHDVSGEAFSVTSLRIKSE